MDKIASNSFFLCKKTSNIHEKHGVAQLQSRFSNKTLFKANLMHLPTQNLIKRRLRAYPHSVLEGRTPPNNAPIEIHVKKPLKNSFFYLT